MASHGEHVRQPDAVPQRAAEAPATEPRSTYRQILESTAWIGGSSAMNLAIGLVRTKAMAMLLGPAGFGLMGVFTAIADVARSFAEMGINGSGVRQIADAAASGDAVRIARTAAVLRRTALILGVCGAALLALFSRQVSIVTFGDDTHSTAIALLSLAVFFRLVADAQGALVQGLRRIADLAKINVLAPLFGTIVSIPLVYWLREAGVALAVVAIAITSALASWWYSRKLHVERPSLTMSDTWREASALLKLGAAFMASGLMMMGAAYVVRLILIRQEGLDAAGLYQSAWTLGGLYVGFVLQAMGSDFYPRLVGAGKDHALCNRLVNEQAHVSLLFAGAGVLATISLAPLVLTLLYSAEFAAAAETLRWICLGMALRVVSWPMGYIIVAQGAQGLFFATELAWTFVNVGLSWLFISWFGLAGAGIAFFATYVFHVAMIYAVVRRRTGFRWSAACKKAVAWLGASIALVFCAFYALPVLTASVIGVSAAIVAGLLSLRLLLGLMASERLPHSVRRMLRGNPLGGAAGGS